LPIISEQDVRRISAMRSLAWVVRPSASMIQMPSRFVWSQDHQYLSFDRANIGQL
jgi:hypothetical protein